MHIVDKLLNAAYQDAQLLDQRQQMGDVLSAFRDVEFCIDAPNLKQAEIVCNFINDNGYGAAHVSSGTIHDSGTTQDVEQTPIHHQVIVVTHAPITQAVISSLTANMESVADIFGCDFNGWGAVIITADDAQ